MCSVVAKICSELVRFHRNDIHIFPTFSWSVCKVLHRSEVIVSSVFPMGHVLCEVIFIIFFALVYLCHLHILLLICNMFRTYHSVLFH